jgi:hypothetical protein
MACSCLKPFSIQLCDSGSAAVRFHDLRKEAEKHRSILGSFRRTLTVPIWKRQF